MVTRTHDEFICDLAQYYHVYNWREFPLNYVAILANGLPENSRTKMKLNGQKVDTNTMILALIADHLAISNWFQTEDGQKGKNRPKSLVDIITHADEKPKVQGFKTADDFERKLKKLQEGG